MEPVMLNQSGPMNTSSPGGAGDPFGTLEDIDVTADRSAVLRIVISNRFVLTLPFWAVDTALDFSWPFGGAMCKIILSVTVMNMYASVFFPHGHECDPLLVRRLGTEKAEVAEGHDWLALYHVQKILVALRHPHACSHGELFDAFTLHPSEKHAEQQQPKRRSRVTRSVTIVVLSFFLCWMPNHAITFWGVLVKFNAVHWDTTYYVVHTYVFPVTVCLAHANSCLNPVLYCLIRPEFRKMLRNLFWRLQTPSVQKESALRTLSGKFPAPSEEIREVIPLAGHGQRTVPAVHHRDKGHLQHQLVKHLKCVH
ncbi:hypothetical protein CRUP_034406 [Coryphaenoides rupestris]|nr:hypothetical protein CRUP_034406 [Coryphaenoides rupestris]